MERRRATADGFMDVTRDDRSCRDEEGCWLECDFQVRLQEVGATVLWPCTGLANA